MEEVTSPIWKPVKGYEDFYEVSENGDIRTIERYITLPTHTYLKKQKMLTQFHDGRGYMHVKLYDGKGKCKSLTTHKIVALTYIPNPNDLIEINHKDGNKLNNKVSNLEWSTRSDNIRHAYEIRSPESYSGESCNFTKLTKEQVIAIRKEYAENNVTKTSLARKYNLKSSATIAYIVERKTWKHV